jgi:hypothetical protein
MHEAMKVLHATDGVLDDDTDSGMIAVRTFLGFRQAWMRIRFRFSGLFMG